MSGKGPSEREIAVNILMTAEKEGTFPGILLKKALDDLDGQAGARKAFLTRLCEGTAERRLELDRVLDAYSRKPMTSQRPLVRQVLRTALYQILYMDKVPDSAAIDEAVRLVRKRGMGNLTGFVNGILRSTARDHAAGTLKGRDPGDTAAVHSIPAWIADLWRDQLGREETDRLLEAMDRVRPICIRFAPDISSDDRERILSQMKDRGCGIERGRWMADCVCLTGTGPVRALPGFSEGAWTVQDESSMFPAVCAGLTGTETVIDVCASPGGKAMHAAGLVPGGQVLAFDIGAAKVERIRENARRMRLHNLHAEAADALVFRQDLAEKADVLFCDLPCSGLGILGRKGDIRYRVVKEDLPVLSDLQRRILSNVTAYLKPGGVLIYSTCTIDRAENEDIAAFIAHDLGLHPEDLAPFLPDDIPGIRGHMLQLLPHIHGTDGFFLARFRKGEGDRGK